MPLAADVRGPIRWAAQLRQRHRDLTPIDLVAGVVDLVAAELGYPPIAGGPALKPEDLPSVAEGWGHEWLIGVVHEQSSSAEDRRSRGAWYTPQPVVEGLLRIATDDEVAPELIVDPTCGGGAFLLAGLERLVALGLGPAAAASRIAGMDLDPAAVRVTRWSVQLWLTRHVGPERAHELAVALDVCEGDALSDLPSRWRGRVLIVGNPPFASPLKKGTIPDRAAAYRQSRAELLGPYADLGAIHLLHALDAVGDGSTVALVQPQSILAGRDTEALRCHVDRIAPVSACWATREAVFDAGVRACALVMNVGRPPLDSVVLFDGPRVSARGSSSARRWSALAADALGAPNLPTLSGRRLAELASATAGFRDEYYAMVAACRQALPAERSGLLSTEVGRVVTVGSVDPLTVAWGSRPFRFGGTSWTCPVVDRNALPPKVQRWFDRLHCPKVLLATQAKLLEPAIDRTGDMIPATPLIAVLAEPNDLDRVAAVLLAPPIVLWAWRQWFGAALSVDAVKLAAKQVGELPLPTDVTAWNEATALLDRGGLGDPARAWDRAVEIATIMTEAYEAGPNVLHWWKTRLKPRP